MLLCGAAGLLIAVYFVADIIPGFYMMTPARLVLLCTGCFLLWGAGFMKAKQTKSNKMMKINLRIFLALFLLLFITLTLVDPMWGRGSQSAGFESLAEYAKSNLNLVPFKTIINYILHGSPREIAVNLIGNFICLMPLGILLPLCFEKQRKRGYFILTCALIVTAVELLQLITMAGACDIDDLILNIAGAYLVFEISQQKSINAVLRYIFLYEKPHK